MLPEVEAERARCASLCDELASRWERQAAGVRDLGTYYTRKWFFGEKVAHVLPGYEKVALDIEAAAHGLRTIERGIREGWGE